MTSSRFTNCTGLMARRTINKKSEERSENGNCFLSNSTASCDYCWNEEDSSSLGYCSGHSSTYSDAAEARIDDLYRKAKWRTPMTDEKGGRMKEAEFYDLDSVDSLSLTSFDYDCISKNKISNSSSFDDIDWVEPSQLLARAMSSKMRLTEESGGEGAKDSATLGCIPEEEHIYEEVHYDSAQLNLDGLRPPPLPKRTYHDRTTMVKAKVERRTSKR